MVDTVHVDTPPRQTVEVKARRMSPVKAAGTAHAPRHPAQPRTAVVVDWGPLTKRRAAGPILPCSARPGEESYRAVLRCHFADVPLPED